MIYNNIQTHNIYKTHIINKLHKITQNNHQIVRGECSIFAEILRKSAKFYRRGGPEKAKNGPKTGSREGQKQEKCIFILLIHSKITKKCKKNKKKWARVLRGIQKKLFLHSQTTTTWGERKRGVVNREMFIERMKECSKYSS